MSSMNSPVDERAVPVSIPVGRSPTSPGSDNDHEHPLPTPSWGGTASMVRRAISVFTLLFMIGSFMGPLRTELKQYHAIGMSTGFVLLLPELLAQSRALSQAATLSERAAFSARHFYAASAMTLFTVVGWVLIIKSKIDRNKQHLTTWHGLLGALCMFTIVAQVTVGALYYFRLLRVGRSMYYLRVAHKYLGIAATVFGCAVMYLGMQSNFAARQVPNPAAHAVLAVITTVLVVFAYFEGKA